MKKPLNNSSGKKKNILIKIIVIFVFIFFFVSVIVLSDRKYFYIEKTFKCITKKINYSLVRKLYNKENSIGNDGYISKIKTLEKENNELKDIIDLKGKNTNYMPEVVISRASYNWYKKIEITNNNHNDKEKVPVINQYGLVGFVSKTSKSVNEVELLTNMKNNLISVLIETDNKEISGVLKYYDSKKGLFIVSDIIDKNEIKDGDRVVLSGYQSNYKGIFVGNVASQEINDYGLTKAVLVKSNVNFDDIVYVFMVGEK